ncbi:ABC transporter ATP-binding protein [Alicyclobacillus sacchari]|uniref:ABC transporter ATP-binding protein n=1 Tax=Alicyclobacillus sacchari TaxID=392010 RepID=UPI0023E964E5|nr:ABC transporter ATP-binding protein [Alicyclobacillus sacchari]GMA57937.1 ABC transporter ATP-binding protein [Alicyclobacillus sacchari]
MATAISFENVVKRYHDIYAVNDVSCEIEASIVALLGPNGAGKTTAISIMLGLTKPTSGRVRAFGEDPMRRAARRHYGVMLQQVGLPQKVRVGELVDWFRSFYDAPLSTDALLDMADLRDLARKEAVKLSGGQQRRLQFAMAMAGNPRILFLDEPTTGMDISSRRGFWDYLRKFAKERDRTIILTTHHLDEAETIADRVLVMQKGRVIADGSVDALKRQAGNRYVSFWAGEVVTEDMIAGLPHVNEVRWSGRHVRITTDSPDDVLRAVILANLDVSGFEVSQGQLEDAFVSLTARDEEEDGTVFDGRRPR